MDLRRLRGGELLAAGGAAALVVLLLLDWFALDVDRPELANSADLAQSGWSSLGWLMVLLLVVLIGVVVWLEVATIAERTVGPAVMAGVIVAALGTVVLPVLLVRVALFQPALDAGVPNALVDVRWPAHAGLLATLAIAAGGWWSIGDERTRSRFSAYSPPAPRPVPPSA